MEINMLFQHAKQLEAMDMYTRDLNKGVLPKKKKK